MLGIPYVHDSYYTYIYPGKGYTVHKLFYNNLYQYFGVLYNH